MKALQEIKDIIGEYKSRYANLRAEQRLDEDFYELKFGKKVPLPEKAKRILMQDSARRRIDVHMHPLLNGRIRVRQPTRKEGVKYEEKSEMVERFFDGWVQMLKRMSPSPLDTGLMHGGLRGEFVWKVLYDDQSWMLDKQEKESEESYQERLGVHKLNNFPLRLIAVEPTHCYLNSRQEASLVPLDVVESYKRNVGVIHQRWANVPIVDLSVFEGKKSSDEVDWDE